LRSNVPRGGHDDTRLSKAGDQPRKETLGSFGVSARLHKDIQQILYVRRTKREAMISPYSKATTSRAKR
jgi:hypothetical protein